MSRKPILVGGLILLLSALLSSTASPVQAQAAPFKNLSACSQGAFSTEEDFMMTDKVAFDNSPYVSDGDLLSPDGQVCARNAELLSRFGVGQDLGLDGVDILNFEPGLVAFSTELDSPLGTFSAGDILITNGTIIPNSVLVAPFGIRYNIGLDELKFMGDIKNILAFVNQVSKFKPDDWKKQGVLPSLLKEFKIDIWFSIEGTYGNFEKPILDGDLLSASGSVIATNRQLLEASVPAGIPKDGIDFGLDAFAVPRDASRDKLDGLLLSTEINYDGKLNFTDGDILLMGGGVITTNASLVAAFHPAADFLGLDALWIGLPEASGPHITHLCDINTGEFNGGTTTIGGPGTGLHESPLTSPPALTNILTQPCGADVPIRGFISTNPSDPVGGVKKYRVAYREVGTPPPAAADDPAIPGIQTTWTVFRPKLVFKLPLGWQWECAQPVTLATDSRGWMNAQDFMDAKYGTGIYINPWIRCDNPELRLAVWSTTSLPAGNPNGEQIPGIWDREDHYVLWLEWQDAGSGNFFRENVDHHLQLDNTLPIITDFYLMTPDGKTKIAACGETPTKTNDLQVWAQYSDLYYSAFGINVKGGNPPNTASYSANFYDPNDGTPPIKNTDDTGTMPDLTTVHLRDIHMNDLGASFTENPKCCYLIEMYVYDRAIRHTFNGQVVNNYTGVNYSYTFFTFSASP